MRISNYIFPTIIVLGMICILAFPITKSLETKLSLLVLMGTALIYAFQLMSMNSQKEISKQSFKNQENILQEQKDIAYKQYQFEVFKLRMELRNELYTNFTLALSANNLDISDDVNVKLVEIGKILNRIEFVFPKSEQLKTLISRFKRTCESLTRFAQDKQIIIECSEKKQCGIGMAMDYKKCIRVWSNKIKHDTSIINQEIFNSLNISEKQHVIIRGIIGEYIDKGNSKAEIEDYVCAIFTNARITGNRLLDEICSILDKHISL
ncbi:MAG: hypothetical protein NC311_00565 [Muribaculaceae bacterium]|nr:hypothetical protein [Muribaculaceae bacterium]